MCVCVFVCIVRRYTYLKTAFILFGILTLSCLFLHTYIHTYRWKLSLYAQLMLQESWRDDLKDQTREAVQTSGGISEITLDELGETLVNYGKQSIPHSIQADLKAKIRQTVVQSSSWNETK